MLHTITFVKASGAGNDFVLIDNMDGSLQVEPARLAVALCSRPFGVGADGLLVLERSTRADFFMRYYNADGSYGGMCGNGGRCAARYAFLKGHAGQQMRFEALDHVYRAEVDGARVKLWMKDPSNWSEGMSIEALGRRIQYDFVDTGSPHAVIREDALEDLDVAALGRAIRTHGSFAPDGTNVDFIRIRDHSTDMRTYERGVEAETVACGTGAVASALIAAHRAQMPSPVHIKVRSGEELLVHYTKVGNEFRNLILEGSAHMIFTGRLSYDAQRNTVALPPA